MPSPPSVVHGLRSTSQVVGLTPSSVLAYILPPFACQYLMGVLVQLEGTRFHRLALLPVLVWLAWRATLVDASEGIAMKRQANSVLITQMCSIATRSAVWAFARTPYRRNSTPAPAPNRTTPEPCSDDQSIYTACWNTWDLMLGPRGIGWNWPRGLVVPKPTFETDSRVAFACLSALSFAFHAFAFDVCIQSIRALSPDTFGSLNGGSLFDHTLPPVLELLRAVFVSTLGATSAYLGVQYSYQILAAVCVLLFRQRPSQWPPLFDSPWLSTSLSELWGRRFHQLMRDMVCNLGRRPFEHLFGKLGGLIGAFLVSGIFHDIELRSNGTGGNSLVLVGFWTMQGVGVVLERVWKKVTGRPVGGTWGWAWMFGWLMLWGVPTVNEFAKVGRFGALSLPGRFEPSLALLAFVRTCFSSGA